MVAQNASYHILVRILFLTAPFYENENDDDLLYIQHENYFRQHVTDGLPLTVTSLTYTHIVILFHNISLLLC